jgi:hypothetical protein
MTGRRCGPERGPALAEDMEVGSVQALDGVAVRVGDSDVGENHASVCVQ